MEKDSRIVESLEGKTCLEKITKNDSAIMADYLLDPVIPEGVTASLWGYARLNSAETCIPPMACHTCSHRGARANCSQYIQCFQESGD